MLCLLSFKLFQSIDSRRKTKRLTDFVVCACYIYVLEKKKTHKTGFWSWTCFKILRPNSVETWQRESGGHVVCAAPLWIISRYICHYSPARGGSNGAPWPGLCALLSALWKSPKDSRQKHILTHAANIHLALDTAGSDLSPLLNNNMVDRNHSARVSSSTTHTHTGRQTSVCQGTTQSHLVRQTSVLSRFQTDNHKHMHIQRSTLLTIMAAANKMLHCEISIRSHDVYIMYVWSERTNTLGVNLSTLE